MKSYDTDIRLSVTNEGKSINYRIDPTLYLDPLDKSFLYIGVPEEYTGYFSCNNICNTLLNCGKHRCQLKCHAGDCPQCGLITKCCCGKKTLEELLMPKALPCSSTPPSCGQKCLKLLNCGKHKCNKKCHPGPCDECKELVTSFCRCGMSYKSIKCIDKEPDVFLCDNVCKALLRCGRHTCKTVCCPYHGKPKRELPPIAHCCSETCNKLLNCGIHKCDLVCHDGECPPCAIAVTDVELKCSCGKTVIKPPYRCGIKLICNNLCEKERPCGHHDDHLCHPGPCPPCAKLVTKMCVGGHVEIPNVICSNDDIRCNSKCGKLLPCGHYCIKQCHSGPCYDDKFKCTQPCQTMRKLCGHICGEPCHFGKECENTQCHEKVQLTCKCGRRIESNECLMNYNETEENLSLKNRNIECDDMCLMIQRSKAFAEALGIDVTKKVGHKVSNPHSVYYLIYY